MYKDKEKQREANRERQRRYKLKQKALLSKGVTKALPDGNMSYEIYEKMEESCNNPPRRGRDITKFEHLPLDVQASIARISDGDDIVKANRTAVAINYQHQFPGRFYH